MVRRPGGIFACITLPLAFNGTVIAGVIFLIAWGEFLYATGFLVDPRQYRLLVLIAAQIGQYGHNWPALMSIAVATGLPTLLIFLMSCTRLREGLALACIRQDGATLARTINCRLRTGWCTTSPDRRAH